MHTHIDGNAITWNAVGVDILSLGQLAGARPDSGKPRSKRGTK